MGYKRVRHACFREDSLQWHDQLEKLIRIQITAMAFNLHPHRVAVYGTLKRGRSNHGLLRGARYVGTDRLVSIALYDLGPYPAARLETSQGIEVEIYAVTPHGLSELDQLEEHFPQAPERSVYDRKALETRYGTAWVYLYNLPVKGCPRIAQGSW